MIIWMRIVQDLRINQIVSCNIERSCCTKLSAIVVSMYITNGIVNEDSPHVRGML